MSKIRISGDTSGYIDLEIPAIAGTNTVNLDKIVEHDGNGNVGIGTASPSTNYKLDVRGRAIVKGSGTLQDALKVTNNLTAGVTGYADIVTNSTLTVNGNESQGSDVLRMGPMNTLGAYFIDVSNSGGNADYSLLLQPYYGKVGIGTDSPSERLDVDGVLQINRTGDHPAIRFQEGGTTRGYMGSGDWAVNYLNDDDFGIASSNTGDLAFAAGGTERLRLLASGDVGINNPSPTANLDVKGDFRVTRNVSAGHASEGNWGFNISHATVAEYGTLYVAGSASTGGIIFSPNNTQAMKIASNGNVSMPQQPSANAYVNSGDPGAYNYAGGANSVIIGSGVRTNVGNCYNNTTGRFTCPTAGRYFVSFSANFYNSGVGSWWRPLIQKNGSTWTQHYENASGTWAQLSASTIVDCAAGDYLNIYNQTASGSGGGMDVGAYSNINFHKLT
jgi:hypothetical protein